MDDAISENNSLNKIHSKKNCNLFHTVLRKKPLVKGTLTQSVEGDEEEDDENGTMLTWSAMAIPCRPLWRPMCFASTNTDSAQLRTQLDQLHAEAERTRAKANSARLRLLRLSEAVEKLRKQATLSLKRGKETDARELLFQKKKVMQALEKSKVRIELLDELCTKLNEVISTKESQLIGTIAADLDISQNDTSSLVHIVSPKEDDAEVSQGFSGLGSNLSISHESTDSAESDFSSKSQAQDVDEEQDDPKGILAAVSCYRSDGSSNIEGSFSYEDFLEWVDYQLGDIEGVLATTLRGAGSRLEHGDGSIYKKQIAQLLDLFDSIRGIRKRISSIRQSKMETA